MLANTADTGTLEYNTADATLWFLHAIDRHVAATGDDDLAAELVPALDEHPGARTVRGTRYGIGVDPADGLLAPGRRGLRADLDGRPRRRVPVTPRAGKAVEINALWINGAGRGCGAARPRRPRPRAASPRCDAGPARRSRAASRARTARPATTSSTAPAATTPALRPNQLLACSLPHAPLRDPRTVAALAAPRCSPRSGCAASPRPTRLPRAAPRRPGRARPRLPPGHGLAVADRPVRRRRPPGRLPTSPACSTGCELHLAEWGLGSVCETADGDAPHAATGCPFQAWSVAETLRVRPGVLEAGEGRERRGRSPRR